MTTARTTSIGYFLKSSSWLLMLQTNFFFTSCPIAADGTVIIGSKTLLTISCSDVANTDNDNPYL